MCKNFIFEFTPSLSLPSSMDINNNRFHDGFINGCELTSHGQYFRLPFYMSEFHHKIVRHYANLVMYDAEKNGAVMHNGPPNETFALKIYSELLHELEKTVPLTISGKKYDHMKDHNFIKSMVRLRVKGFFLSIIAYVRWVKRCKETLYNPLRLQTIGFFRQIENELVSM